jgi:hypothetical protein
MKSFLYLVLAITLLDGCTRESITAIRETGDRVFTVDEFLAQPELRRKVAAYCHNDPGRTGLAPNCVNVRRAEHLASMGTADSLHIDMKP